MKRLTILAFTFLAVAFSQGGASIETLPDVTGTGAVVQLSASGTAISVQIQAASGNSGLARCGDINTSSSRGERLPAGAGIYWVKNQTPGSNTSAQLFTLSKLYCYIANADVITVTLGH